MRRTLPADHAVQEDLKIKKRMVDVMEQTSIRNADSMQQMNANLANITSTIQDGAVDMDNSRSPHHVSCIEDHTRLHWPTHQEQTPLDHTRKR